MWLNTSKVCIKCNRWWMAIQGSSPPLIVSRSKSLQGLFPSSFATEILRQDASSIIDHSDSMWHLCHQNACIQEQDWWGLLVVRAMLWHILYHRRCMSPWCNDIIFVVYERQEKNFELPGLLERASSPICVSVLFLREVSRKMGRVPLCQARKRDSRAFRLSSFPLILGLFWWKPTPVTSKKFDYLHQSLLIHYVLVAIKFQDYDDPLLSFGWGVWSITLVRPGVVLVVLFIFILKYDIILMCDFYFSLLYCK